MKIILLSGGSGKRLWPLSNNSRSKQFLKFLTRPDGGRESMIQRVVRQIGEAGLTGDIVVATGSSQKDATENQLGDALSIVTEPVRRDTFPAIALACSYLSSKGTDPREPVIVMPCDSFADDAYFKALANMSKAVESNSADLVLMGLAPTYPSSKYGYMLPVSMDGDVKNIKKFIEKPDVQTAGNLISEGALWNGGVFAFRLGYLMDIVSRYLEDTSFENVYNRYTDLPKISFDYEVVEKASSVGAVTYSGKWKDLGTWNILTDELSDKAHGNVVAVDSDSSFIINELNIPLVSLGAKDMIVAASPDGILVADRIMTENLKPLVDKIEQRPMYEKRRWGEYKVIDSVRFDDGHCALTKQLTLQPGKCISYQKHNFRDEVWTFINGEGEIVLDGVRKPVKRGDIFNIPKGQMHALKATTPLTFIEVQSGSNLIEEDIERFPFVW